MRREKRGVQGQKSAVSKTLPALHRLKCMKLRPPEANYPTSYQFKSIQKPFHTLALVLIVSGGHSVVGRGGGHYD